MSKTLRSWIAGLYPLVSLLLTLLVQEHLSEFFTRRTNPLIYLLAFAILLLLYGAMMYLFLVKKAETPLAGVFVGIVECLLAYLIFMVPSLLSGVSSALYTVVARNLDALMQAAAYTLILYLVMLLSTLQARNHR